MWSAIALGDGLDVLARSLGGQQLVALGGCQRGAQVVAVRGGVGCGIGDALAAGGEPEHDPLGDRVLLAPRIGNQQRQ